MGVDTKDNVIKAAKAIQNAGLGTSWPAVEPHTFYEVKSRLGNPDKAIEFIVPKRDRHRAGKLTQKVWDSLVYDPASGVAEPDPAKAVPMHAVNTDEYPTIDPAGDPDEAS